MNVIRQMNVVPGAILMSKINARFDRDLMNIFILLSPQADPSATHEEQDDDGAPCVTEMLVADGIP